jgi:hypothetical protein
MSKMNDINIDDHNNNDNKSKKIRKLFNACEKSGLTKHFAITGHNPIFANVKILEKENNYQKRSIKEMINIKINNTLNKYTVTVLLHPGYAGLLHKIVIKK